MTTKKSILLGLMAVLVATGTVCEAHHITEIIDATGDGAGNTLDYSFGVATDSTDNVYVGGGYSDNAFMITPGGVISQIIDATGDGAGNPLDAATGVTVDSADNVYVAGWISNNVFKITPDGTITEIIDITGDGAGNPLWGAQHVAVDSADNVYVAGATSDNVFKISPIPGCSTSGPPCPITEIIDASGDGIGNPLESPVLVAVDSADNVYVAGWSSDNAFKITPGGTITEIIDATGDRAGNILDIAVGVAVDSADNVYVTGNSSDNAFMITPTPGCSTSGPFCPITEIIDASGDGSGNALNGGAGVGVDSADNVFVGGQTSDNAFMITPTPGCSTSGPLCPITEIIDATGGGAGNPLDQTGYITADRWGNVYVGGEESDNAFRIEPSLFADGFESGDTSMWSATAP